MGGAGGWYAAGGWTRGTATYFANTSFVQNVHKRGVSLTEHICELNALSNGSLPSLALKRKGLLFAPGADGWQLVEVAHQHELQASKRGAG